MSRAHDPEGPGTSVALEPASAWPFAGRERELDLAGRALLDRRGVVLIGDAGTGRTRLATAIGDRSVSDGVVWHAVAASPGASGVALGAWAHLLPGSWAPGDDDPVATWRLVSTHLARSHGTIHLLVDDAHWLDATSAGLLHHLVTTGSAKAVITIRRDAPIDASIRPSAPSSAAWTRPSPSWRRRWTPCRPASPARRWRRRWPMSWPTAVASEPRRPLPRRASPPWPTTRCRHSRPWWRPPPSGPCRAAASMRSSCATS